MTGIVSWGVCVCGVWRGVDCLTVVMVTGFVQYLSGKCGPGFTQDQWTHYKIKLALPGSAAALDRMDLHTCYAIRETVQQDGLALHDFFPPPASPGSCPAARHSDLSLP
jgi:hypothetical protein